MNVKNETTQGLEENLSEFIFILNEKKGFSTMTESPDAAKKKMDTFDYTMLSGQKYHKSSQSQADKLQNIS